MAEERPKNYSTSSFEDEGRKPRAEKRGHLLEAGKQRRKLIPSQGLRQECSWTTPGFGPCENSNHRTAAYKQVVF